MADGPDGPVRQDVSDQDMNKPPPPKLSGDGYDAPEMTAGLYRVLVTVEDKGLAAH